MRSILSVIFPNSKMHSEQAPQDQVQTLNKRADVQHAHSMQKILNPNMNNEFKPFIQIVKEKIENLKFLSDFYVFRKIIDNSTFFLNKILHLVTDRLIPNSTKRDPLNPLKQKVELTAQSSSILANGKTKNQSSLAASLPTRKIGAPSQVEHNPQPSATTLIQRINQNNKTLPVQNLRKPVLKKKNQGPSVVNAVITNASIQTPHIAKIRDDILNEGSPSSSDHPIEIESNQELVAKRGSRSSLVQQENSRDLYEELSEFTQEVESEDDDDLFVEQESIASQIVEQESIAFQIVEKESIASQINAMHQTDSPIRRAARNLIIFFAKKKIEESEGVFRTAPSKPLLDEFCAYLKSLDLDGKIDDFTFKGSSVQFSADLVSGALKRIYKEINLFGEHHQQFIEIGKRLSDENNQKETVVFNLQNLIYKLSEEKKEDLQIFLAILHLTSQKSDINRMGASNLAIALGPTFSQPVSNEDSIEGDNAEEGDNADDVGALGKIFGAFKKFITKKEPPKYTEKSKVASANEVEEVLIITKLTELLITYYKELKIFP